MGRREVTRIFSLFGVINFLRNEFEGKVFEAEKRETENCSLVFIFGISNARRR